MEEQKNGEGKGGKYLEKGNIWSREDRKNGERKRGKYLDKENIWTADLKTQKSKNTKCQTVQGRTFCC